MKWSALVHPGFEEAFIYEATALLPHSSPLKIGHGIVSGKLHAHSDFLTLLHYSHLCRRLLIDVGCVSNLEVTSLFPAAFPWEQFFTNGRSFRVEIEGVPGQENRLPIAKQVAGALFSQLETHKIIPTLELRNPQQLALVYFDGEKYFFGLDFTVKELDAREYRLFAHAASFKGDSHAFFLSMLGYKAGQKLLVGFAKDGSAAIEAALIANHYPLAQTTSPLFELPFFTSCHAPIPPATLNHEVFTFDETTGNLLSIRKNATLAGIAKVINARKQSIEDLDVAYGDSFFDCLLFHLTRKDEEKLNEVYYQSALILKPKGKMLIVSRSTLELPISEKFTLLSQTTLERGQSLHTITLLEKN